MYVQLTIHHIEKLKSTKISVIVFVQNQLYFMNVRIIKNKMSKNIYMYYIFIDIFYESLLLFLLWFQYLILTVSFNCLSICTQLKK